MDLNFENLILYLEKNEEEIFSIMKQQIEITERTLEKNLGDKLAFRTANTNVSEVCFICFIDLK